MLTGLFLRDLPEPKVQESLFMLLLVYLHVSVETGVGQLFQVWIVHPQIPAAIFPFPLVRPANRAQVSPPPPRAGVSVGGAWL